MKKHDLILVLGKNGLQDYAVLEVLYTGYKSAHVIEVGTSTSYHLGDVLNVSQMDVVPNDGTYLDVYQWVIKL